MKGRTRPTRAPAATTGTWPWERGHKSRPLDPELYDRPQVLATTVGIRPDHPLWRSEDETVVALRAEAARLAMLNPDSRATKAAIALRDAAINRQRARVASTTVAAVAPVVVADGDLTVIDLGDVDVTAVDNNNRSAFGACSCGARWTGARICHCARPGCHRTFTSIGAFDAHRVGGHCATEAELERRGYEPNDAGHWRQPAPEGTFAGRGAS